MSSDLTLTEQKHVRTAIRYLRLRAGGLGPIAKALGFEIDTVDKVTRGVRTVSASMAFRVARLAEVPIDQLLAGEAVPQGTCPHCGRPADFVDETTIVD